MSYLAVHAFNTLLPEIQTQIFSQYYVITHAKYHEESECTLLKAESWQEALLMWLKAHPDVLALYSKYNEPHGVYVPELTPEQAILCREQTVSFLARRPWGLPAEVLDEWRDKIVEYLTDTTISDELRQLRYYGILGVLRRPAAGYDTFVLGQLSLADRLE